VHDTANAETIAAREKLKNFFKIILLNVIKS
jgi:hypothetical protein